MGSPRHRLQSVSGMLLPAEDAHRLQQQGGTASIHEERLQQPDDIDQVGDRAGPEGPWPRRILSVESVFEEGPLCPPGEAGIQVPVSIAGEWGELSPDEREGLHGSYYQSVAMFVEKLGDQTRGDCKIGCRIKGQAVKANLRKHLHGH
jgi:hypothetical protein